MTTRFTQLIILSASLAVASVSNAQVLGARPLTVELKAGGTAPGAGTGPAVNWPASLGNPTLSNVERVWDELSVTRVQLRFPSTLLEIDHGLLSYWEQVEKPAGYGIEWRHRWTNDIHLGLAELPRNFLPPDLPNNSWQAYVRGLKKQFGKRIRFHCDDASDDNVQMLRLLSGPTRVLEFEIDNEKTGEPEFRVIQVFAVMNGAVIVYALYGPTELVDRSRQLFEGVLRGLQPPDPE